VGATVHTPEGLNTMVYNRCVGITAMSNQLPYKVRRFNFLLFSDFETESLKLMRNPDVSVRSRGVMEKCSYCVQRISAAKIEADQRTARSALRDCDRLPTTGLPCLGHHFGQPERRNRARCNCRRTSALSSAGDQNNIVPRTKYVARGVNPKSELQEAPAEHNAHAKG